ncbi:MAG: hypothetical protein AB7U38_01720 [Hyphomicrobiales bacterium]
MTTARRNLIRNTLGNGAFFAVGALVFIGFSILYTREFGIERYGEFSFFLNTVTALISLGAYEGFLIAHSATETRRDFDAFNRRFNPLNIVLILVAGVAFSVVSERIDPWVVLPIMAAIYLDYRSQSSIGVLITAADNWKIRAIRTVYQVLLVAIFLALQLAGLDIDHSFAAAALVAALTNYGLLLNSALAGLSKGAKQAVRSDVTARVLAIAIFTNLATVLTLLIDKFVIRQFDVGTDFGVGVYFLFFDLATRVEALYLLVGVPVTNHLFNALKEGALPRREVSLMALACAAAGLAFAIAGLVVVPWIYAVPLDGVALLPWLFGLYVAARGVRFLVKAVCNAAGHHEALLLSNILVLAVASALLVAMLAAGAGKLTIVALAAIMAFAQLTRLPVLAWLLISRHEGGRVTDARGAAT